MVITLGTKIPYCEDETEPFGFQFALVPIDITEWEVMSVEGQANAFADAVITEYPHRNRHSYYQCFMNSNVGITDPRYKV